MSPTKYLLGRWRKPQSENKNSPAAIEGSPLDSREIPLSFRELLIAPVLLACGSYASFTILDISFRTVFPVYFATPINMGGLGLDPPAIGTILASMVLGGILQLLFFAPLRNRLGGKAIFLATISLFIPIAAPFPNTNHITQEYGMTHFAWFLIGLQTFLFACACLAISKPFASWLALSVWTSFCFQVPLTSTSMLLCRIALPLGKPLASRSCSCLLCPRLARRPLIRRLCWEFKSRSWDVISHIGW